MTKPTSREVNPKIRCWYCGEEKELSSFHNDRCRRLKHSSICKPCSKFYQRDKVKRNPELYKQKAKKDRVKFADKMREYSRSYNQKNKDKTSARYYVKKALEEGLIIKTACEICGRPKVVAHHDDYTKPTDVRWLCQSCHQIWHEENGEGKRLLSDLQEKIRGVK